MLPSSYEPTDYRFRINDTAGTKRLLLTTTAMEKQARVQPTTPLWWREMGDDRSLNAMVNWVRLRRTSWNLWGHMAKAQGSDALQKHFDALLKEDPPVEVTGILIEAGEDGRQLSLGDVASTPRGMVKRIYYTHTFFDEETRQAFQGWLLDKNPEGNGNALLDIGLDSGTDKLAAAMDEIAADKLLIQREAGS